MSRQEMIDALGKLGFDTSTLTDGVPDGVLPQLLAMLEPEPTPAPAAQMAEPTPDEMKAKLADAGHNKEELDKMSDEELKAAHDAKFPPAVAQMADGGRDD